MTSVIDNSLTRNWSFDPSCRYGPPYSFCLILDWSIGCWGIHRTVVVDVCAMISQPAIQKQLSFLILFADDKLHLSKIPLLFDSWLEHWLLRYSQNSGGGCLCAVYHTVMHRINSVCLVCFIRLSNARGHIAVFDMSGAGEPAPPTSLHLQRCSISTMMSGAGAVRFPWFDYFWCESRISLGAIHEFLSRGVGLLPPSPWGTADRKRFLCSSPP